jgi:RHS repeat-associated protein
MTRNTKGAAQRSARRRPVSRRFRVTPRAFAALLLTCVLLVPPPALASPHADGLGVGTPSSLSRALASLMSVMATALSGAGRGRAALPGARVGAAASAAQLLPPTTQERESRVTRLAVPELPLDPTPPPLYPPDQNTKVYGPLVLQSREPINLTALPLDSRGNAVSGVQPWWSSTDRTVVFVTRDGRALAGKPGTAILTASLGTLKAVVVVQVVQGAGKYGGQKPNSTRTAPATPPLVERRAEGGVRFVNASWSSSLAPRTTSASRGARGIRFVRASVAEAPRTGRRRVDYEERLPDDETGSLYDARNDVGAPPGRTEPGAPTPPAATSNATETPGSDNFSFSVPAVGLPGRGGLDVNLALSYNSRLWNKSTDVRGGQHMTYDVDAGWPAPGFRLGYGYVEAQGTAGFTLVDPGGTRHPLEKVNPTNANDFTYETTDGTFIRYVGGRGWGTATYTNGTQVQFGAAGDNPRAYPIRVTDSNGNFILISYRDGVGPHISTIQDTMGRYVRFRYQGSELVSITVPGYAGGDDRQNIRFYYESQPIAGTFTTDRVAPTAARVIRYVYFPATRTGYRYDYSSYGMIYRMVDLRGMTVSNTEPEVMGAVTGEGEVAATTEYNYPVTPVLLADAPTYTARTDDWAGRTSFLSAGPPVQFFQVDKANGVSTVTAPDGTQTITTTLVNPGQWDDGLVRQVEIKQGSRTFSRTVNTWEHDGSFRNQRPQRVDVTDERNETRSTVYSYASFNNVNVVTELGFGGEDLRRTQMSYETRQQYIDRRLLRLPVSVSVYDGRTNALKSRTDFGYDEAGSNLTARNDLVMHDPAYNPRALTEETCNWEPDPNDPDYGGCVDGGVCDGVVTDRYVCTTRGPYRPETVYRGNLSSVTTYPRATNPDPATAVLYTYSYDIAGNLVRETADCCQQRAYTYEKAYEYAYPTVVARGAAGQVQTRMVYDFNTGLVRQTIDENGQPTTADYNPDTLRPSKTTRPDMGYTLFEYGDGAFGFIKTSSVIDSAQEITDDSSFLVGLRRFNGRGNYVRTATRTPDGWATVDLQHDEMSRLRRTSNPYYAADPFAQAVNPPGEWTEYNYDGIGRRTDATTPDGVVTRGDFSGRVTTVTDAAGRQRRSLTDALGRLERLDEPDASGNLGPVESPAQPTSYDYDALDDLVRVTQGQQQRFWRYDSMGRLTHERQVEQDATISAPDPESDNVTNWSRRYEYTSRSQVSLILDARGVQTTFTYDGLNRVQQISYSDGTPAVTFTYDEAHAGYHNQGRLTKAATAATASAPATAQEYDYDLMGRVAAQRQHVDVAVYAMGYAYNSLDQLKSESYPGGRLVFNTFDFGARVSSVTDGGGVITYAGGIRYAPHGAMTSETFGNGAVRDMSFNRRLQPASNTLTKGAAVLQQFRYSYGQVDPATGAVDASKNTGQIGKIEDYAGGTAPLNKRNEQRYVYDALGRLDLAAEFRGSDGALTWRADYAYDRYGNRLQSAQAGNQNFGLNYLAVEQGDVDPATNRLRFAANNLEYDAAGNVKTDPRFRLLRYEYDAESRMKRTTNVDGGAESTAVYDGAGQRVVSTANGETHHFVYDAQGRVIAEYGPAGWERDRIYRGGQLLATDEAVGTCRKTVEQFVESFFRGAFDRPPTDAERNTWVTQLRAAQGQGQAALLAQARSLGSTLFNSAEYAGRQRSDEEFVHDLYWGYLQRAADADGFLHWLDFTRTNGRAATITAFGQSTEFGNLVAALCTNNQLTGELHWVMTDHVGSVRVVLDSKGGVVGRRDNLPFGDSLRDVAEPGPGGGGNAPMLAEGAQPSGLWTWSNSVRTQYAGMEKDVATGLDHTPFRKYDSGWGRWTSPDPYGGSMNASDPQSFNRYAYVSNDPVNSVDPSGLAEQICDADGKCYPWEAPVATAYSGVDTLSLFDDYFTPASQGWGTGWGFFPLLPTPAHEPPTIEPTPNGPYNGGSPNTKAQIGPCAQLVVPGFEAINKAAATLLQNTFGEYAKSVYEGWPTYFKAVFLNTAAAAADVGVNLSGAKVESFLFSDKFAGLTPGSTALPYGFYVTGISGVTSGRHGGEGGVEIEKDAEGTHIDVDLYNPKGGPVLFFKHQGELRFNDKYGRPTHPGDVARQLQKGHNLNTGVSCKN